ncbi:MAG: glycoside hydrolase family 3 C-terminal domain-containing protein [Aerococcaceae bacterium]|nr:glycoside hydrolase family 3 C-terminal domain-containing protein [Aerococcaceae bacterium]
MNVEQTTQVLMIAIPVLVVALVGYVLFLAKKTNGNVLKRNKLFFTIATILSVFLIASNIAINLYNNVVNLYVTNLMSGGVSDEEALQAARENSKRLTTKIQEEGIVLLENKNNALPLQNKKVNVFGVGSVSTVYGGSGSGASDESANITIKQGLEAAGFELNADLVSFYEANKPVKAQQDNFNLNGGDYNIYEVGKDKLTDEQISNAVAFSDTALVVFSRNGGEGGDLPMDMADYQNGNAGKSYLELQDIEEELLNRVKAAGFKNVVVLVNSSNAMELGFLQDEAITGALWIGGPGATGNIALGRVLSGEVNPSGRLVNTYAYDVTTAPAYYNAGDFAYLNSSYDLGRGLEYHKFLNYNEGIYVGYRFYETRFVDNKTGNVDEAAYDAMVQYPFGYGLSYTTFEQKIESHEEKDGVITVKVKVTNTGKVAGKDVVQVYYTAPYTEGGVEKSHVVLAAFDKTGDIAPGASETVELQFSVDSMASYDYQKEKAYVLDKGTYIIKLMNNAHELVDSFEYNQNETVVFNSTTHSGDQIPATNLFEDAQGDLVYVSRSNWEGTLPKERTNHTDASETILTQLNDTSVQPDESAEDIVFADHGLKLADVVGLDYNDPKWDQLLEQVSVADMVKLIGYGGYATQAIDSIGKPATVDTDGPAGINNLLTGITGVQFNSGVVIASTWNQDIATEMGDAFAQEALANDIVGLYAPAVNIHRTPFSGRNFEYYSEDPVISGKMAAGVVKAALDKGVYTYLKHFAVNDQETNRLGVATWSNEQAIREIYLKAFEIPVKEGGSTAIMSSFNRIGTRWTGASNELLNTVLRDEWGFKGMVLTDYNFQWFMDADQAVFNGNDLMLTPVGREPSAVSTETPAGRQALRQATKNILYTVANSAAAEKAQTTFPYWLVAWIALNGIILGGIAFLAYRKSQKVTEEVA